VCDEWILWRTLDEFRGLNGTNSCLSVVKNLSIVFLSRFKKKKKVYIRQENTNASRTRK
jgi:hypothetical protein